jgi:hypothetical protein
VKNHIFLIAFALVVHLLGYYALFCRIEPFQYYFYVTSWWSYIILLDAIVATRRKGFVILNRYLALTIFVSCAFWCLFEIINLRLDNWFYVNLPQGTLRRYFSYLVAFGTVIPAIFVTKKLALMCIGDIRIEPLIIPRYPFYAIASGLGLLFAVFLLPRYFFGATWMFLALILDGHNYRCGYPSFMKDLERGSLSNLIATLISGLLCGLLWEAWNYRAISKWIYTVPFFTNFKIFEMPLPGYLGFLTFSIETIAFVNFLQGSGIYKKHPYVLFAASAAFSLIAFPLIDSHTILSYANFGR